MHKPPFCLFFRQLAPLKAPLPFHTSLPQKPDELDLDSGFDLMIGSGFDLMIAD
jgi:hypothetical protein